ncbi:TPA: AAA family ATPase [Pseudomonas aeruginosa]|uniref:AAA family ATPase n=4 Tax=Pseudomonas aeruginosa TaxID=287 RepID=A0A0G4WVU1_PSEAI|nr:ATP-binding protein [Pseudomonas aeruginosa]AWR45089.1 AAA family ATPase [Pseudomonas aeruginosa]EIU5017297.1 AAA family ATPase [Pseudomonas aeruginosa]EIU6859012.1 AAA family ATPase [Pseudomonas aeruginosa]EIU6966190.1 AAA family ATPase [Pseudomonas aeruginosa]EIU6978147.1 AAA family ATPase [Pseudomonas aeruginosa]
MARADLLVSLVQSGMRGDKAKFRKITEAIIVEERSKQHKVLADRLESALSRSFEPPAQTFNAASVVPSVTAARDLITEITSPQKRMQDLILPNQIQEIVGEIIQEHHRVDLLRSYNLEPRNRLLLIGPPGNGKTSLAEGVAEALMVPLLVVRYESIVGTYLGETAVRLKKLFEYASSRRCVLFFDEFETLGKERGDTHETGEIKRVVSSLLLQIDSLPSHVVVIGATNHAELLDRAVWRRFQVRIEVPQPTRDRLAEWFERFQKKHNLDFGYSSSALAKRLYGCNFSEAEEFCLNVLRRYILELPNPDIKPLVTKELQLWSTQTAKTKHQDEQE